MTSIFIGRRALPCDACAIRNRALCRGLTPDGLAELNRMSIRKRFTPGAVIQHEAEPASWCGVILSGVVKLVKSTADGRQQIVALQFPGDYVGEPFGKPPKLSAEAAGKVEICSFPRAPFEGLLRKHSGLGKALLEDTMSALDAAREWMLVLGRKTAEERLATFLVLLASKAPGGACREHDAAHHGAAAGPASQPVVDLPLSRSEIGKLLGLRIETVSRQISALKSSGTIATIGSRGVRILDLPRLTVMAETEQD